MKRILLFLVLFFCVFVTGCNLNLESGRATIIILDSESETLFHEEIDFTEEDTLVSILEEEDRINMKSQIFSGFGLMVLELCGVKDENAYWAVYLNGEYSMVGVSDIELTDEVEIKFILTPME